MTECEVMHCNKQANLGGLCLLHRRKDIAGELEYDDGAIWDTCSRGHRWTLETTRYESNSKGGRRRRCKLCLAERADEKRGEAPPPEAPGPVALGMPQLRDAHALADKAQAAIDAKCRGNPEPYTDYNRDTIPSDAEAAKLCAGCPLMAACGNKAAAERPAWGVWGAQVWVYGEPWAGDRSKLHDDD